MISDILFNCSNKDTYPPFKNGLYLEEYFYKTILEKQPVLSRTYIPAKWTNFQIQPWFLSKRRQMQQILNDWVNRNPSRNGYFTIVQHDNGVLLKLPANTIVYGSSTGHIQIPLIYEDVNHTLESYPKKSFSQKPILCSFVGTITANHVYPNVRQTIYNLFHTNPQCTFVISRGWTSNVSEIRQSDFINTTIDSKFAFAPRGYGRASFRFYECFQLGTIPIYIWNDAKWLPFQDQIDYSKLCICLHVNDLLKLMPILENIDESTYNDMWEYYETVKHLFQLEGMTEHILSGLGGSALGGRLSG